MCTNSLPDYINETMVSVFPGQKFEIEAVAVGQRYGLVPSIVTAELLDASSGKSRLGQGKDVQSMGRQCTILDYTVHSNKTIEKIRLTVGDLPTNPKFDSLNQEYHSKFINHLTVLFADLVTKVELNDCLLGFVFDENTLSCLCSPKIKEHRDVFCDMDNYYITKTKQLWLSVPDKHTVENHKVIIHDFCPYDYCKQLADEKLSFHLESPDDQCAFNRSGILRGACQENLSQVFGTSK